MDHDRLEDPDPAAGRRRFLKQAGALAVVAPLAAALHAAAQAGDAEAATVRKKAKPAAAKPAATDPFASARPDTSICRTPEERATLERQWKGMVDLVQVIRDAPLDPSVEPVTVFAALPREA